MFLRFPTFLRTEVRPPFARGMIALDSKCAGLEIRAWVFFCNWEFVIRI